MLLPDDVSGKVGKIDVVGRGGGEVLLDSAYGEARAGGGRVRGGTLDAETLRKQFGARAGGPAAAAEVLAAVLRQRLRPAHRRLARPAAGHPRGSRPAGGARGGGDRPYRPRRLPGVQRPAVLARAKAVRDQLVEQGFDPARIELAGRGEREPLVPTADEVPEPKNRRVEVPVR